MTNRQYMTLMNYILEGDEGEQLTIPFEFDHSTIIDNAKKSVAGARQCIKNFLGRYRIYDFSSFVAFINKKFRTLGHKLSPVVSAIKKGISTAVAWVKKIAVNNAQSIEKGGLYLLALVCGAVASSLMIISKHLSSDNVIRSKVTTPMARSAMNAKMSLKNKMNSIGSGTVEESYSYYLNKSMDRAVIECKAMFSDLGMITESLGLSEGPLDSIMNAGKNIAGAISSKFRTLVDSYINNIFPKVNSTWDKIGIIAKQNKTLAIIFTVCTAVIFSFIGIKKGLEYRKKSLEQTIESVIAKKAKKGASAGKKLATKSKAGKSVKAKSNIKAAAKKMAKKK